MSVDTGRNLTSKNKCILPPPWNVYSCVQPPLFPAVVYGGQHRTSCQDHRHATSSYRPSDPEKEQCDTCLYTGMATCAGLCLYSFKIALLDEPTPTIRHQRVLMAFGTAWAVAGVYRAYLGWCNVYPTQSPTASRLWCQHCRLIEPQGKLLRPIHLACFDPLLWDMLYIWQEMWDQMWFLVPGIVYKCCTYDAVEMLSTKTIWKHELLW
jgi:hypothetical protein